MACKAYIALTAAPLDTAPVWTDAGRVIGANIRRGRRGNEGPTEPGSADIRIDDPDRRLDPTNPGSPWAADLGPMRQVKIDQEERLAPLTRSDTFTRTDSTTTPGSTEGATATPWTVAAGTWGIDAGRLRKLTADAVQEMVTVDVGSTDQDVSATMLAVGGGYQGLALRFVSTTSYLLAQVNNDLSTIELYEQVPGVGFVPLGSAVGTVGVLRCVAVGPAVSVYRDGTLVITAITTRIGTRTGVVHYNTAARTDGFTATADGNTERLFTGFLDDVATSYNPPVSTVRAVDGLAWIGAQRPVKDTYAALIQTANPYYWWRMDAAVGATMLPDVGPGSASAFPLYAHPFGATKYIPATPSAIVASPSRAVEMPGGENFPSWYLGSGFSIASNDTFTLATWIRFPQVPTQEMLIYTAGYGNPVVGLLQFGVNAVGKPFISRRDYPAYGGGTTTVTAPTAVTDGQWHHIEWLRSGANWGVAVDAAPTTSTVFGAVTAQPPASGDVFNGGPFWLDEGMIFPRLLTTAERTDQFQAARGRWGTLTGGQQSGARVGVILDQINWPASWRSVDAGLSPVIPPTVEMAQTLVDGSALAHLERVRETEEGRLHCTRAGVLRFVQRPVAAPASVASYANTGGLKFIAARPSRRRADIINHAEATRPGGVTQVADDFTSQARYLRHDAPNREALWLNDAGALAAAQRTVARGATARTRIDQLVVNARIGAAEETACAQRELGDVVTVTLNPPGGTPLTLTCYIEGITHTIDTGRRWTVTYDLTLT